ncbi:MAG: hypothetical protein Q9214_003669 [Letrouitia sp. 1 TL-2023]
MNLNSIREFLHRVTSSPRPQWQRALLETSITDNLLLSHPSVKLLQSTIAQIDPGHRSFEDVLGQLLNNFSAPPETKTDAVCCLRAAFQILIIYSITTANTSWLRDPRLLRLEKCSLDLSDLISSFAAIPKPLSLFEPDSLDKCRNHAILHGKKGQMELQRDAIITTFCDIVGELSLGVPFQHYNPENALHPLNMAKVLEKLSPQYRLVSEAFSLVIYPVPSEAIESQTLQEEKECFLKAVDKDKQVRKSKSWNVYMSVTPGLRLGSSGKSYGHQMRNDNRIPSGLPYSIAVVELPSPVVGVKMEPLKHVFPSPAIATRVRLAGAEPVGAELVGAELVGAELVGSELVGAELVGAELFNSELAG